MPRTKKLYRKKRYSTKRRLKRRMRKYQKQGYQLFKLRADPATTGPSALGFYNVRGCLTNPTRVFNGGTTVNDWSNVSGLFDSFRVCGIKIKYIPRVPNDTSAAFSFAPVYGIIDYENVDTASPVATASDCMQYERLKIFNYYRPWKWYIRVPKYNAPIDVAGGTVTTLKGGFVPFN